MSEKKKVITSKAKAKKGSDIGAGTRPAPRHLVDAIRKELRSMVDAEGLDGDLERVARFSASASQMLRHVTDPSTLMKRHHGVSLSPLSSLGSSLDIGSDSSYASPIGSISMGYQGSSSTAPGVETYGASILRQIIPALKEYQQAMRETPTNLVEAIADARRRGMPDVAAELEKKLCGKALDGARPVTATATPTVESYLPPLPLLSPMPLNYDVKLIAVPAVYKIAVIKAVRELTGMSLKEAKDATDIPNATLLSQRTKSEAEDAKKRLEEAGARVVLLPSLDKSKLLESNGMKTVEATS